jgi:hypothetical protein
VVRWDPDYSLATGIALNYEKERNQANLIRRGPGERMDRSGFSSES